jgi:broad specificity phosphatase PhoE
LIRHGQSESNANTEYLQGSIDCSLTPKGFKQAHLLGKRLKEDGIKFDRVYSSSLLRTVQTTQTMLDAMGDQDRDFPQIDDIVEQKATGWTGLRASDVLTPELVSYMRTKAAQFVPPDGESFNMVQRRVSNWLEDELLYNSDLIASEQMLRIAIVGHGIATKCLMRYILGFDEQYIWKMTLENTSISRFRFNHAGWIPVCINDTAHLRSMYKGTHSFIEASEVSA